MQVHAYFEVIRLAAFEVVESFVDFDLGRPACTALQRDVHVRVRASVTLRSCEHRHLVPDARTAQHFA